MSDRLAIASYGAKASWPAGFQLYQRGSPADGVFIVLNGHVVLRSKIKAGRGFVSAIATSGQTFGAEGLTPGATYATDANASDVTETLSVSGSQFRALVREQPGAALTLMGQVMAERTHLLDKLHELAALNVEERLVSALLRLGGDHAFTADDGRIKLNPGHHRLLCEMVGATRESIALALSRLVSSGSAERRGTSLLIAPLPLAARARVAQQEGMATVEIVREPSVPAHM